MADDNSSTVGGRERPLSPHLSIYKPQITSFTSIMHRLSGVFLLLGVFVFAYWLYEIAVPGDCNCVTWALQTIIGKLALFAWTLAIYYHLFNGIRHLLWDVGLGFEISTATRTGWLVIIITILATAGSWVVVML